MMISDLLVLGMVIFVYGTLVAMIFRLRRVMTAHEKQVDEIKQNITYFEQENARIADYEGKRQVEIDAINAEIQEFRQKIAVIEERISPAKLNARQRVYLANDRRSPGDHEFLVKVRNERMAGPTRPQFYADSWRHGRTYVLWATNLETARSNAEIRFPGGANFIVESVEHSPFNIGNRFG